MTSYIQEIRTYKTDDGKEFRSLEASELHVVKVRLAESIACAFENWVNQKQALDIVEHIFDSRLIVITPNN